MQNDIKKSSEILQNALNGKQPKTAILLGSGLNVIADEYENFGEISYNDLPGFPKPTTKGHAGKVTFADLDGTPVIFLQGRLHYYEGVGIDPMKVLVRTLKTIGVEVVILTNAAGSTHATTPPGSLVSVQDHINLTQFDPLRGANDEEWGPRFLDAANLWNVQLLTLMHDTARDVDIKLGNGIFAMFSGPSFETAAEVRMVKMMGADTVGMSLIPEALLAHHCGLKVCGCSAITNLANGLSPEPLSHEHTLKWAKVAKDDMSTLLNAFVKRVAETDIA